jgi:hypothetical protein
MGSELKGDAEARLTRHKPRPDHGVLDTYQNYARYV